jgi:assimilatory nitrate reductase catalytic subunit
VWLFNGLLAFLHQHGAVATQFVASSTSGVDHALRVAEKTAGSVPAVAKVCGVEERALAEFYRLFARTERTLTIFSQGVNQSSSGADKVNSIINCHLLTGRIGRPGMGPFSVTGQPNAMGGREVGGLATTLAAHMDIERADHRRIVQEFWKSAAVASAPGLKAVDLFDAIHDGRVKAVWIMATNPIVSLPDADRAREALRRCELVVASDCVQHTDTTALAHVLLPAAGWAEKDGTVTNSDRRISRQRAFLPLPGEARPDWWIVCQVARRLGHAQAFAFEAAHEIFAEHAALSGAQNDGGRAFHIGGLSTLSRDDYDRLAPIQWPVPAASHAGTERLLSDGRYFHPDGKARFVATPPRPPVYAPDGQFSLVLNTGRVRDQWHTMTRTGYAPRLSSHTPEPYVDMHAQDALLSGTREGELVRVATRWGSIIVRLRITGEMPRGMIFVPIHWNGAFSSDARVGALVNPIVDPVSGEPEFKHTPARVTPFSVRWHGFVLARHSLASPDVTWWTLARGNQHLRYEIAGRKLPRDWSMWARRLLNAADDADWIEYSDPAAHVFRGALLTDDRISACVYLSPRPDLPSRTWLASLFERDRIGDAERAGLLMGQPADPRADTGPIVCSCFGIGRKTISDAIRHDGLGTTQEIGKQLRAGTNCGSCVAEIRALLIDCGAGADS